MRGAEPPGSVWAAVARIHDRSQGSANRSAFRSDRLDADRTDQRVADAGRTIVLVPHDALQDVEMCPDDLVLLERRVTVEVR